MYVFLIEGTTHVRKVGERKWGKENTMWGLETACMHMDVVFVSGVLGRDSILPTGDAGHKMQRCLALDDATGEIFSPFTVCGLSNNNWGTRLKMLLSAIYVNTSRRQYKRDWKTLNGGRATRSLLFSNTLNSYFKV
jgi:hypothetical protein